MPVRADEYCHLLGNQNSADQLDDFALTGRIHLSCIRIFTPTGRHRTDLRPDFKESNGMISGAPTVNDVIGIKIFLLQVNQRIFTSVCGAVGINEKRMILLPEQQGMGFTMLGIPFIIF